MGNNKTYDKPNLFGMTPIKPDTMKNIKKGDKRFIWLKGDVREIEVLNTYNHKQGICINYVTKTTAGSTWVDISELFKDKKKCIQNHLNTIKKKHKTEIKNIQSKFAQTQEKVTEEGK